MKKFMLIAAAMIAAQASYAGYLCSYSAYIENSDRYNSNGTYLVSGHNKSSAAAVLRQERADYYRGGPGSNDCYFHRQANRATMAEKLRRGSISSSAMNKVLYSDGRITVDIYSTHIVVK